MNDHSSNYSNDLIVWFEETSNAKYPDQVRHMLQKIVDIPAPVDIKFEAGNFGEFAILDFRTLQKARDGHPSSGGEESMSNPFFARKEISHFIESYMPEDHPLWSTEVLPLARSTYGDRTTYVYFRNGIESPIRLNIDYTLARPRKVGETINDLIDVDDLMCNLTPSRTVFNYNKKRSYKQLFDNRKILVTDGERVDGVSDYRSLLREFCAITSGELELNNFEGKEVDGRRHLTVTINSTKITLDLEGNTDWVDPKVIEQLNNAIATTGLRNRFIPFRDSDFGQEFGLVYGDDSDFELLRTNGYTGNFHD